MIKDTINKIYKIPRCLASKGNRETLNELSKICGEIKLIKFKSGTKIQDWVIPMEWEVLEASLIGPNGKHYIDYKKNNLSVVINSISFTGSLNLAELKKKIHFIKKLPNAIPYITNYYSSNWGFCMKYNIFKDLPKGLYKINLKTHHRNGYMDIGEVFLKGKSKKEIIFTCNICHPQMANNELSGPAVMVHLIKSLKEKFKKNKNYYSYRFLFLPETIGSIAYINKNLKNLKKNCIAGVVLTCLGGEKKFKVINSPFLKNYSIKVLLASLVSMNYDYEILSYNERGSDERQFCFPGVDLPFTSLVNQKYGDYKEYHTSLDDLSFISEKALKKTLRVLLKFEEIMEINCKPYFLSIGEPKLDIHGIYPNINTKNTRKEVKNIMNFLAYSNKHNDLIDISKLANLSLNETFKIYKLFSDKKIIKQKKI